MRDPYRRLSVREIWKFLSAVVRDAFATIPTLVLLETVLVISLYLIILFPLDLLRSRYLQAQIFSKRLRLTFIQDAPLRIVRFAFETLDHRIGSKYTARFLH